MAIGADYGWKGGQVQGSKAAPGKIGPFKRQKILPKASSLKQTMNIKLGSSSTQDKPRPTNQPTLGLIKLYQPPVIPADDFIARQT